MPMPQRQSNSEEVRIRDFCKIKYWCKFKLCMLILLSMDTFFMYLKWRAVTYSFKRSKTSVVAIMVHPSLFALLIMSLLFVWYGVMKEKLWACKMFFVENLTQIIVADALLLADMVVITVYGRFIAWSSWDSNTLSFSNAGNNIGRQNFDWVTTASATTVVGFMDFMYMAIVTCWQPVMCVTALELQQAVKAKLRGDPTPEDYEMLPVNKNTWD